jgi:hypothetical protein
MRIKSPTLHWPHKLATALWFIKIAPKRAKLCIEPLSINGNAREMTLWVLRLK